MLVFWGVLDRTAYYLTALGILSIMIAVALYFLSRWAFWLGLFTFPILFVDFLAALILSVNLVGWFPGIANGLFQASLIIYLVFLTFSLLLLIDKRNTLRSDRILDTLRKPLTAAEKPQQPEK